MGTVSTDLHEEQPEEQNIAEYHENIAPGAWGGGPYAPVLECVENYAHRWRFIVLLIVALCS